VLGLQYMGEVTARCGDEGIKVSADTKTAYLFEHITGPETEQENFRRKPPRQFRESAYGLSVRYQHSRMACVAQWVLQPIGSSHPKPLRCSVLSVPEVSQLFDDIMKAASNKAEPIKCNVVLMNAGRQTEVSMAIALALQYQLKNALA
jgi:hypothetical protein